MPNFTTQQMRDIMDKTDNIRNLSIIAHVDHGKSTLTDSLVAKAGIISKKSAGNKRETDTRIDEQERGITIKSTGVSMVFKYKEEEYLINLIDSPGHVDFSSEVTAALRVTDGAIVVVDCIEGVCVQTETVLRQAVAEKVKPILFMNKLDRVFLELKLDLTDVYTRLKNTIENVNVILGSYEDKDLGNIQVDPRKGTVSFGSGYHQWAFGLEHFAELYAPVFNKKPEDVMKYLWGNYLFDNKENKWTKKQNQNTVAGFVKLVLEPIRDMIDHIMNGKEKKYKKMIKKLGIKISKDNLELSEKKLVKIVMQTWLPASNTLMTMMINHLPSPREAQKYRGKYLYTGPHDMANETYKAIHDCDKNGPLVMYVSKMIPMKAGSGRFYAFGRVFSGTIKSGVKLTVMGANHEYGTKKDIFKISAQRVVTMMGAKADTLVDIPCGNTCGIVGIDGVLVKTGTITSDPKAYPIKDMKYTVSPVVRRAVTSKKPADLPKLVEGLKRLSKSDPLVLITMDQDTGENIVAGAGELHLEICMNDLQEFMSGAELIIKEPIVAYRETITTTLQQTVLSKSPNKHNRIFVRGEPLSVEFQQDLEDGNIVAKPKNLKEQARYIAETHGMDINYCGKRLWGLAPIGEPTNIITNQTKGVAYLDEIQASVLAGFNFATMRGPLCNEPIRGVKLIIEDVKLHADAIHRGMGQIMPTARNVTNGVLLKCAPRLMEPIYKCTITVPDVNAGSIYSLVTGKERRGTVIDEAYKEGSSDKVITCYLPVSGSFGFNAALKGSTGGKGFASMSYSHWNIINSDPLEEGTYANKVVNEIRKRKKLGEIKSADYYLDRL